ncbi:MAG: hypothetical protein U0175_33395 [Caldilineaceae bacterium]
MAKIVTPGEMENQGVSRTHSLPKLNIESQVGQGGRGFSDGYDGDRHQAGRKGKGNIHYPHQNRVDLAGKVTD